ncbi:leucine--tRNA ligase [Candidatus Wolfebacteria bacterium CG10_big_fil_rev_8_21_14_0_10_31_9]|uniref:Leucine--tRNA ligase n=1 Tax=Candidatus Wolfebacteria bacterium CG10_big_fil_rev_8_21_14_0_10_31_9 TaxID=1975070 RepID=A0A2H0RCM6_9BACT|nr:MAG: leucine--tRNA ligase [Candidatus Wolfebacteria bacterium CG10_big_fil_rev_8_21_14_0_10_31_9]
MNFKKIEAKWRKVWGKDGIYKSKDNVKGKENHMLLTEFPYPSGNLHIGHWYAFAVPDILARFLRMKGKNVVYPMGFDAFGLPAENAAIKRKINPRDWTEQNIKYMTNQLKSMGATFDWSRVVSTIDPEYYKWTQWIFLQFYKKGLAYRAKTFVNWCSSCKTVLANEQVVNGKCERCETLVVQKEIEQWMFKITEYADKLIDDLEKLDWPQTTKLAQKNWIGRSSGINITYDIEGTDKKITVYTTRPDTNFGAIFIVIAPDSSFAKENESIFSNKKEIHKYIEESKKKSELERIAEGRKKTGVFTGIYAINNLNGRKMPIYISDFVLATVGTGVVVGVPGHDIRDFEFAKEKGLEVIRVVVGVDGDTSPITKKEQVQEENGKMINSGFLDGLDIHLAIEKIKDYIEKNGWGKKAFNYRLHDWVLSRQRYWGVPIPVIKCDKCGFISVPEKDLPIKLPPLKDFLPTSDGKSPLAKVKKWVNVKCPKCKGKAERETDTMDTFVDSSWYFIRYTDSKNKKKFADTKKMKSWLPVPMYIGGAEHNTMHLLYSRFFTKALYDLRFINFNEPFIIRRNHGVILGPDNQKMSKSRGNVIDPDKEVEKFGADAVRMYLAFMGPYGQGGPWQMNGIVGIHRFLQRVWNLYNRKNNTKKIKGNDLGKVLNQMIKKVGEDIENQRFNTAVSGLMILLNKIEEKPEQVDGNVKEQFLKLLAPFAPYFTEEIWREVLKKKKSIHLEKWPTYDPKLIIEDKIELVIQINGKFKDRISTDAKITKEQAEKLALNSERIKTALVNQKIKKIIFVSGRLINIVV